MDFFFRPATAKMHKGPFSYIRRRTGAEKFKKITAFHSFFLKQNPLPNASN
ncbi:hypothetical protein ABH13_0646 [Bacillus velezensis]|nr:hypothetical protein ABH13_0646 [Bacillus velezensis]KYC90540.1 hypothetical protein B4140_0171 [Bacillus amyloliquefaciens]